MRIYDPLILTPEDFARLRHEWEVTRLVDPGTMTERVIARLLSDNQSRYFEIVRAREERDRLEREQSEPPRQGAGERSDPQCCMDNEAGCYDEACICTCKDCTRVRKPWPTHNH